MLADGPRCYFSGRRISYERRLGHWYGRFLPRLSGCSYDDGYVQSHPVRLVAMQADSARFILAGSPSYHVDARRLYLGEHPAHVDPHNWVLQALLRRMRNV